MLCGTKDIAVDLGVPTVLMATCLVLWHHLLLAAIPDYVFGSLQGATHNTMQFHSAACLNKALLVAN